MKTFTFVVTAVLALAPITHAQITISQWTFETSPPADLTNSKQIGVIAPDVGNGAVAEGLHTSSATDWSTPEGNGSANSLSANTWAPGDYYIVYTHTIGFADVSVSYDHTSSINGPRDFTFSYTSDGLNFVDVGNYSVLANAAPNPVWNSTTSSDIYRQNFDLSAISELDNRVTIVFRILNVGTTSASGGTVEADGTSRIDNFTVQGVPEPSTIVLLCLGAAGLLAPRFRR